MSLPLIIQVPSDTTATQWEEIHRALNDHRSAFTTASAVPDIVSNFPPAPTAVPATSSAPSLLDTLTAPTPTVASVVPVPEPIGDPLWLGRHISDNNSLPEVTDDNWAHIMADMAVRDATKGSPHEPAVKKLRQQAAAAKARWVKSHKPGNGQVPTVSVPATQAMTSLAGLLTGSVTSPVLATQSAPVTHEVILPEVEYVSQLTDAQRSAVWAWHTNLTGDAASGNQGVAQAWLQGALNPANRQPLALSDIESASPKLAEKIRRQVKVALKG